MAPNPWTGASGWLVHAADLKSDDMVLFTPSTLDFQWLDSSGRRFEIAYEDQGRRRDDQGRGLSRRPYLLDELETLAEIWKTLKSHLGKNQIYIQRDLIEVKREEWQIEKEESPKKKVFMQFCRDALANAKWKKGEKDDRKDNLPWEAAGKDREAWLAQWADYAARCWLADAVELHLQIMKEEIKDEL
jgi:hypothetical protein